eukprot:UN09590
MYVCIYTYMEKNDCYHLVYCFYVIVVVFVVIG